MKTLILRGTLVNIRPADNYDILTILSADNRRTIIRAPYVNDFKYTLNERLLILYVAKLTQLPDKHYETYNLAKSIEHTIL